MQTTTQFAFVDRLADRLAARPALAAVVVASAAIDQAKAARPDIIELLGTELEQVFGAIGARRMSESYDLLGEITVVRPGASEADIRATRNRAKAILAELETELRDDPTLGAVVMKCRLARVGIKQGYGERGRYCVIEFAISAEASLTHA